MKKFMQDYLKIFAYTAIGLAMIISSFYLLMNYYHSKEVDRSLYITEKDINYTNYQDKLTKIKNNLTTFANSSNTNSNYQTMYSKLTSCSQVLDKEGMLSQTKVNKYYKAFDVYNLGSNFQTNALNTCWALQLSYLTDEELLPKEFEDIAPLVKNNIETINSKIDFAMDELQNNSSYFMTTRITSATVRNNLNSDYQAIASSYNDFANIILSLSEIINNGGNSND